MAKKDKKVEKTTEKKEKAPEFKYGVSDLADELGIEAASVRVQLRNKGVEKAGKSYGWNTKDELKEVVAQLKTEKKAPAKKDKAEPAEAKKEKKGGKKKKSKKSDD